MHTPAAHAPALTATYPGDAQHIRAVRADMRPVLGDHPRADDAILCASELAANAALHSHSRLPGGTLPSGPSSAPAATPGSKYRTTEVLGTRRWSTRSGTTAWTSSALSPTNGASTETTPAEPSGRDSTGLNSRSSSGHVDAVRIFFTIIKGAPSARHARASARTQRRRTRSDRKQKRVN